MTVSPTFWCNDRVTLLLIGQLNLVFLYARLMVHSVDTPSHKSFGIFFISSRLVLWSTSFLGESYLGVFFGITLLSSFRVLGCEDPLEPLSYSEHAMVDKNVDSFFSRLPLSYIVVSHTFPSIYSSLTRETYMTLFASWPRVVRGTNLSPIGFAKRNLNLEFYQRDLKKK